MLDLEQEISDNPSVCNCPQTKPGIASGLFCWPPKGDRVEITPEQAAEAVARYGNKQAAADALGVTRSLIQRRIKAAKSGKERQRAATLTACRTR